MTFLKYRFHYISGMDWGNIGGGSDGEDYDKKTMSDDQAKKIIPLTNRYYMVWQ